MISLLALNGLRVSETTGSDIEAPGPQLGLPGTSHTASRRNRPGRSPRCYRGTLHWIPDAPVMGQLNLQGAEAGQLIDDWSSGKRTGQDPLDAWRH